MTLSRLYHIETYGCQMNVSDSEIVSSILQKSGFIKARSIDDADVLIFNTCSVRKNAEERVLGRISNEASRKKKNPELTIGVIGCLAQHMGQELIARNIGVDFVLGTDQYNNIADIIGQASIGKKITNRKVDHVSDYDEHMPVRAGSNNAFVTIMRGCNNFCSYCIVPYVRGRERSRSFKSILEEIKNAGKSNYKDITLLGQNVNSYNWQGVTFPELLYEINNLAEIKRIRFVTSHPKDLSDDLVNTMAECEKICEHIHLPLQSGSNRILSKMKRNYTIEHYLKIVDKLRKNIPGIAITTDVIAGFPSETEEDFFETYNAMKKIQFDYAFMFRYSEREGTEAAGFKDQVPELTRLERLSRLIELQTGITDKKYRAKLGKIEEIYVEQVSKKSGDELAGRTRDFKIVVFEGTPEQIGTFLRIKITGANGWTLRGIPISL